MGALLGGSVALRGDLSLASTSAWSQENTSRSESGGHALPAWTVWAAVGVVTVLLLVAGFFVARRRKTSSAGSGTADQAVSTDRALEFAVACIHYACGWMCTVV